MKEILALAALAGLLAVGCAPRDSHQGGELGTSDSGLGSGAGSSEAPTGTSSPDNPGDQATPPPGDSRSPDQPSGLRPPQSNPDDSSPDGFFHRKKDTSLTI